MADIRRDPSEKQTTAHPDALAWLISTSLSQHTEYGFREAEGRLHTRYCQVASSQLAASGKL